MCFQFKTGNFFSEVAGLAEKGAARECWKKEKCVVANETEQFEVFYQIIFKIEFHLLLD